MEDNSATAFWIEQGIIDLTATETIAKEPKLEKLLRELKSTPVPYNKKVHRFLSRVSNDKFAVVWGALLRDNL